MKERIRKSSGYGIHDRLLVAGEGFLGIWILLGMCWSYLNWTKPKGVAAP